MLPSNSAKLKTSTPAYVYSIVSVTSVLFILGLMALLMIEARGLTKHFKENLEITLVLDNQLSESKLSSIESELKTSKFSKEVQYVSKEEAARLFENKSGENFKEVLDFNPLFASFNLYLKADYAHMDSMYWIKSQLVSVPGISEVYYQEHLLSSINANVRKASFVLMFLSLVFMGVAFALIDSTIKLAMYSNRFLVKSMQLVGATRTFISKPFVRQGLYVGIISGMLAALMLVILLLLAKYQIPELSMLYHPITFILLCICIILLGIGLSWWSTQKAVTKYLQMPIDELY